ncbi:hypothetical protein SAMN05661091_1829 [Paenibacillus uliginis N3/975]|uniref:Uncharacterized protein n=1 Tax=Paenibacillus uliginis N3/975 TaxID=1313296 RepID=A0A1X7H6S1_9BACL|nr:hypothetical protein [Paenibacillus uliginis]SMF80325.1 hypothetical protein SAMN05661091_1829 [Paenibacillus uliginis N3/975]
MMKNNMHNGVHVPFFIMNLSLAENGRQDSVDEYPNYVVQWRWTIK